MKEDMLKIANYFAKYSTARWNSCRVLRVICRLAYRAMGEIYILVHRNCSYPWPYCDESFAPWKEADDTLITDPANFVIRRSTSYCAWQIRRRTGKWLKKRQKVRYDGKDWGEFLSLNGFRKLRVEETLDPQKFYIGVEPEVGEFGQLYCFAYYYYKWKRGGNSNGCYYACSTYVNFKPALRLISIQDRKVTWYELCE